MCIFGDGLPLGIHRLQLPLNEPSYHTTTLVKLRIIKDHSIVALEKPAKLNKHQQIQKEIYSKQVNE